MENVYSAVYNPDASDSSQISIISMISNVSFLLCIKKLLLHQKQKLKNNSNSPHINLFLGGTVAFIFPFLTIKRKKKKKQQENIHYIKELAVIILT